MYKNLTFEVCYRPQIDTRAFERHTFRGFFFQDLNSGHFYFTSLNGQIGWITLLFTFYNPSFCVTTVYFTISIYGSA